MFLWFTYIQKSVNILKKEKGILNRKTSGPSQHEIQVVFIVCKLKITVSRSKVKLTTISAMTRGCLSGLRRYASTRVSTTTRQICTIRRGSAEWRGSSPWKTPSEVAFIGGGHLTVALDAILKLNRIKNCCQCLQNQIHIKTRILSSKD